MKRVKREKRMLGIQIILIALLVCLLILHFLKPLWSHRTYPPGPFQLPVIGGLWRLGVKLSKDTVIQGAIVVPDFCSVLLDPKQWETPKAFNPNHFLDEDGLFVEREAFLPFGAGGRACVGEQLARIKLFILFTSLMRAFSFQPPEGVTELNAEPVDAAVLAPHPYQLRAVPCGSS